MPVCEILSAEERRILDKQTRHTRFKSRHRRLREDDSDDLSVKSFAKAANDRPPGAYYIQLLSRSFFASFFKQFGIKISSFYVAKEHKPYYSEFRRVNVQQWRASAMGYLPLNDARCDEMYEFQSQIESALSNAVGKNIENVVVSCYLHREDSKNRIRVDAEVHAEKLTDPPQYHRESATALVASLLEGPQVYCNFTPTENKGELDIWINVNSSSQCIGQVTSEKGQWKITGLGMGGQIHPGRDISRKPFASKEDAAKFLVGQLRGASPGPVKVRMLPTPPMPPRHEGLSQSFLALSESLRSVGAFESELVFVEDLS